MYPFYISTIFIAIIYIDFKIISLGELVLLKKSEINTDLLLFKDKLFLYTIYLLLIDNPEFAFVSLQSNSDP